MRYLPSSLPFIAIAAFMVLAAPAAHSQSPLRDEDDAQCQSYGARVGSDAYVDCRLRLARGRQEDARRASEAKAQADQEAIRRAFDRPPLTVPVPPPQQANRPTNCVTSYVGGFAYTNCN